MSGKLMPTFADKECRVVSATDPHGRILSFLDGSRYYFFQVAQLYSRGWVDPVRDPLLLRISGSAGNRTWNLWICSQELWPLDHIGTAIIIIIIIIIITHFSFMFCEVNEPVQELISERFCPVLFSRTRCIWRVHEEILWRSLAFWTALPHSTHSSRLNKRDDWSVAPVHWLYTSRNERCQEITQTPNVMNPGT
jgi:hypothetical protein